MKINNVDKFRNELYEALKDALSWELEDISAPVAVHKGGFEDYEESMNEYDHYATTEDGIKRISLARPIEFKLNGKTLFMRVHEDGVYFYMDMPGEFAYNSHLLYANYKNRLSFAIRVASRVKTQLA